MRSSLHAGEPLRLALPAILVLLLLAGCFEGEPPRSQASESSSATGTSSPSLGHALQDPVWLRLSGNLTTRITKFNSNPGYEDASGGGNCITYSREDVAFVRQGTFDASWTAANPAQQKLRLVAGDPRREVTVVGASPLRLNFSDVDIDYRFRMFVTSESDPGAIIDQEVTLSWALTYLGVDGPRRAANASCG